MPELLPGIPFIQMDKLTPEQRHYNMSQIHGKDTKPEILVRKYLFNMGLRYRKNDRRLPGHPDMVFPKYRTVIFVNGCFWHGHEGCSRFRMPGSNIDFWQAKIQRNKERDERVTQELESLGWRVLVVWECEIDRKSYRDENLARIYHELISEF